MNVFEAQVSSRHKQLLVKYVSHKKVEDWSFLKVLSMILICQNSSTICLYKLTRSSELNARKEQFVRPLYDRNWRQLYKFRQTTVRRPSTKQKYRSCLLQTVNFSRSAVSLYNKNLVIIDINAIVV